MTRRAVGAVAAAMLLLYAVPAFVGTLGVRTAIEILYFALLAAAFNLLFGFGGMLSFGFNATFGVGAYAMALLLTHVPQLGVGLAALCAVSAGTLAGAAIGALCVRLRGGYFSLLTLAFCQFLLAGALKWRSVTKGEDGVTIQAPVLQLPGVGPVSLDNESNLYWLTLTVVLGGLWLLWRFTQTPLGKATALVRENDERSSFLAHHVYGVRLAVFTLASAMAAVAGVLYLLLQRLASPTLLGLGMAGDVLFMTVLGGSGHFLGPVLGAGVYHLLQDALSTATERWPFFIGLLFVALVIFAPGGIAGVLGKALRLWRRSPRGGDAHALPAGPEGTHP